ncbi:MAG: carbon-nitrogen hydrolase family protein [Bacillota bacterium]|nr:carbon-nitrogen hydrolase family protein [Bacillota bacterium]
MGDTYPTLKVAAVQAVPVFLDREATTEKACKLIREAGEGGAKFIVFPEGFIPSHPVWYHFHPGTSSTGIKLSVELFKNSVEIPGPQITDLCQAAKDAEAYVVMGLCEKLPNTIGTMYNTQVFIGPDGSYLGKHQKLAPTVGERLVHKGGFGDTFGTIETEYGPVSGLLCSENSNPLMIMALCAEGTRIHAAAWPNHWSKLQKSMKEFVSIATLNFAQATKAFVISSCATVDERMIKMMELTPEEENILREPEYAGGSMIAAPNGKLIAGPMGNEEGILYADIDLELSVRHKLEHDFAGHYNRSDVFQLFINRNAPQLYIQQGKKFPDPENLFEKIQDSSDIDELALNYFQDEESDGC